MAKTPESKACDACAAAKRHCGKQVPHCLRCRTKGIECRYPPRKPTQFILVGEDDTIHAEPDPLPYNTSQLSTISPVIQSLGRDSCRLTNALVDDALASSWFASLDTWKIRKGWFRDPLSVPDMKCSLGRIRRWLTEWVEKGSNPFIHARLYRTRFPRCIRDAYAALSCYLSKTASNELTVFKIIEDQAKQLLEEYNTKAADSSKDTTTTVSKPLDTLEHIARVQALIVYQFLGLYDGDIRLRYLSEARIPVLESWMREMVQHGSQVGCLGGSIISSSYDQEVIGTGPPDIAQSEDFLWYSWILAESVRRCWVVGGGTQVIFLALQQGGVVPCNGGMMFTTRQGAWEAPSAVAWNKLCSEVHVGLMQMAEAESLFREAAPEEVNEFTKMVLELNFGRERMERWGAQAED